MNEFLTAHSSYTTKYFVAHIFTILLAPFASKLVNYSRHSETLNFRKNSKSTTFFLRNSDLTIFKHFSMSHCASNNSPIWTQKVSKEVQRCELPASIEVFTKIFFSTWMVGCQKIGQYIRMEWGRFMFLRVSVNQIGKC